MWLLFIFYFSLPLNLQFISVACTHTRHFIFLGDAPCFHQNFHSCTVGNIFGNVSGHKLKAQIHQTALRECKQGISSDTVDYFHYWPFLGLTLNSIKGLSCFFFMSISTAQVISGQPVVYFIII